MMPRDDVFSRVIPDAANRREALGERPPGGEASSVVRRWLAAQSLEDLDDLARRLSRAADRGA